LNYNYRCKTTACGRFLVFVWKNILPADKVEYEKVKKDVNLLMKHCESKQK